MLWPCGCGRRLQNALGLVSVSALMSLSGPVALLAQTTTPEAVPADNRAAPQSAPLPTATPAPADAPAPATTTTTTPDATPPSLGTASQPALPTVSVDSNRRRPPQQRQQTAAATRTHAAVRAPATTQTQSTQTTDAQPVVTNAGGGSTISYVGTSTSTATKTNTRIISIPQSITVLTGEFIRDQNFQSLGEALRYVPGVIPHQGEGNRDEVVIRGQRSNADFFVNGIRDDAQYFRDLYNVNRVEVLKGPNAMIFGRGGGGGVINRVLKEADGVPVRELTLQGGQFNNKRAAIDVRQAVSDLAVRFNSVYENSDSYRK